MSKKKILAAILLASLPVFGFSQKNKQKEDTTAVIKEFMIVCNQYKTLPMHLSLKHSNSAAISVSREDTAAMEADFFITEGGSYIRYGNTEQIVNDSLVLMVSLDQQVMMLYPNKRNLRAQLSSFMGLQMADSSVLKMAAAYTSAVLPAQNADKGIIELKNRSPLPGTDIVKEIITLTYNIKAKNPEQVVYIRRTLMPIDKSEWDSLPGHEEANVKLVKIKESYFIVNERKAVFDYKEISHNAEIKLPVSITDRITRNQLGEFVPAKGFQDYHLSMEESGLN
ncbi:MAG: hypothetical protein ACHQFX_06935 [Chitinophagales bacterium]